MPFSPGSDEGQLGLVERLGLLLGRAEARVLGAVLDVEEDVADAAVLQDVDAGAEVGRAAVLHAAGGDAERLRGGEDRLLARVADGVRVGDVVRGDVEAALLGQQAAQRGLESEEGGDAGHGSRPRCRRVGGP